MTKAEKRALEKYPANKTVFDKYEKQRYAFICGYIQAEKDLALTWEDLALIRLAFDATEDNINHGCLKISPMTKEYYEEVLKRFKERKEK